MPSIIALDQGTTGSRAVILGQDGRVRSSGYREFPQHFPKPGWVEHDAEEIWNSTLVAAREAMEADGETPAGLGITNQRETVVAWDRKTGRPLHRALVWQDRRTAERCRALREERGDAWIAERAGLIWDPYFSGTKIEWMLEHVPDLRKRAEGGDAVFGTVDSWLVHRLTGGKSFVTDHTNASRTLLYDINAQGWSADLLDLFGVPRHALPEVRRSSEVVGVTDPSLLGVELPIAGIAGDQQAALFGQGCVEPGLAKCTYGTGAFLLMYVGNERQSGSVAEGQNGQERQEVLTTIACDATGAPAYALEGSIFIAGAAVQWLRDGLELIQRAAETERMARSVDDTGGVYFVPALVGLGAPYWNPDARGTIVGLTRGTTSAHLVRAALEAMAYSSKDVMDAMVRHSGVDLEEIRADGGATANDWLMEFLAMTLGVPVRRPDVLETTALGAAGLAGLATAVWPDVETFVSTRRYTTFEPERARDPAGYAGWQRAVDAALYWSRSS